MRIVRSLADLPGEVEKAEAEAASAFGDGTVFVEPVRRARPPRRGAGLGRRRGHHRRDRRARLLDPAPPPEGGGGGAGAGEVQPSDPRADAQGGQGRRRDDRLPGRRHRRVPLRRGDRTLLLPRDEHPPPGRAPRHRDGLPPGPGRAAAAHRRGRPGQDPVPRQAGRLRDRGPAVRRGPGRGLPAAERAADPLRDPDARTGSASTPASSPAARSPPTTTRCSPR